MIIIIGFIIIICIAVYCFFNNKLDKNFYNYREIYPFLETLKQNKYAIQQEVSDIMKDNWNIWPEKYLFNNKDGWKVFPFYGFGIWIDKNCQKCPVIHNILKHIPGLKTASLSRLKPNTKLSPHQGWSELSNNVLRCQYGIFVKDNCILSCNNEIDTMKENKIIVFDDSKMHFAENNGSHDRIVLILDIERPYYVKKGTSTVKNTDELQHFITLFK